MADGSECDYSGGNMVKGVRTHMDYKEFLRKKQFENTNYGFTITHNDINKQLFDFQKDILKWGCKKGKAALFEDCGLGKSPQQLEWARQVCNHTDGNVLIFAPLAVSKQTKREGEKFGIEVSICRTQKDVNPGINITNYEMIEHFNIELFSGIVLDESSILKGYDRYYSSTLIEKCRNTPYKLSCTATPAPNDYMELGTQCEWLGVMSRNEMLATFFIHDSGDTAKWRLKGHAQDKFWEWVAGWAVVLNKPSDLGYDDGEFTLPELRFIEHIVKIEPEQEEGQMSLFATIAQTLDERRKARRNSLDKRVEKAAEIANSIDSQVLVWCDLNNESESLTKAINGAVEVTGSDKMETKENNMLEFSKGNIKVLVSKPKIAGHGMNWQNCNNIIFVGLSDSYEMMYQAIRRCYRFGQDKEVNVHIVISEQEGAVKVNIERKEKAYVEMFSKMVKYTQKILTEEIHGTIKETIEYNPQIEMIIPDWLGVAC